MMDSGLDVKMTSQKVDGHVMLHQTIGFLRVITKDSGVSLPLVTLNYTVTMEQMLGVMVRYGD